MNNPAAIILYTAHHYIYLPTRSVSDRYTSYKYIYTHIVDLHLPTYTHTCLP